MIVEQAKSIFERAIEAENKPLPPELARTLLEWRLSDEDSRRMDELENKARQGILTADERDDFNEYLRTIDLLSLLHLRAKEALGMLKKPGT